MSVSTGGDAQRITRLTRLMQDRQVHTRDSFIEAQLDHGLGRLAQCPAACGARSCGSSRRPRPTATPERRRQRALELLAEWNGEMKRTLARAADPTAAWMRALQQRLIRDELGPLASEFWQVEPVFLERVFRDVGGAAVWCDVVDLQRRGDLQPISRAWHSTTRYRSLWNATGPTWKAGAGGRRTRPATITRCWVTPALFSWIVNIRQPTSGGRFHAAARGDPRQRAGPVRQHPRRQLPRRLRFRRIPTAPSSSRSTGQSGHPLSRHYDDLGELWRRGANTFR